MNRRSFLKAATGLVFLSSCRKNFSSKDGLKKYDFPIHVDSNRAVGHLVRSAMEQPVSERISTKTLVVGAGIAGMSAAVSLPHRDFVVCELGDALGGTSGAISIGGSLYAQGAHYDLAYPAHYGQDGIELLERLNIIQHNGIKNLWEFQDKEHLIPAELEEACYDNGKMRASILANTELKKNFLALLKPYENQLPLPTTAIAPDLHHLDQLTFLDYLNKYLPIDSTFIESINYQMLDDFGGTAPQISALAGIHYYKCRSYFGSEKIELFSPQQGNYYFIEKMAKQLPSASLLTNHLVFGMKRYGKHWYVDVYDTQRQIRKEFVTQSVVYAGQKHTLQYIHPSSFSTFSDVVYTPWVVVNIELKENDLTGSMWQNDFLSPDGTFLGFVDSKMQNEKNTRVLTAYYCFPSIHHYIVQNLESSAEDLVRETVTNMSLYFKKDISPIVKKAYLKLMGHAMPLPKPGYMTKERIIHKDNLAFAGVDTGRLPLMYDAMDSGIQAVKSLGED